MLKFARHRAIVFWCVGLSLSCGHGWAQQADSRTANAAEQSGLEEVLVTAQRREESVQTVPISITTISADQMQQFNVNSARGTVQFVPNMFGASNTGVGSANTYFIRGLGNVEEIATFDPPVATYIDDIPLARQNANNYSMFDADHIEVLNGPQGTLFGRNTTGGAVSITMKKPAEDFGGFFETSIGDYNEHSFRGSIDIPLSSTVLTKLSAYYKEDDGFVHDLTTHQTLNGDDERGVRAAIRWLAADTVTWDLSADYVDQNYANILNDASSGDARSAYTGLNNDYSVYPGLFTGPKGNYPQGNQMLSHSLTSNVTWKTDVGTLNFITGWRDMEDKSYMDFFDSPLPVVQNGGAIGVQFLIASEERHQQFSQEIKLNGSAFDERLSYVTGLFYLNETNDTDLGQASLLPGGLVPAGACDPNTAALCSFPVGNTGQDVTILESYFYDHNIYNTTHSWAVYGQGDYKLLPSLVATVGARFTDETKGIEFTPNPSPYAPADTEFNTAALTAAGVPVEQSIKIVTPRFALRYDFTPDMNIYVSATNGFRGGGWDARSSTADLTLAFGPEKTWSYETGFRSEWLEHRLRANLTAFYADTQHYQLPTAYVPAGGGGDVFITGNFAALEVHGLEGEFAAVPIEGLTIFNNVGWQQGRYTDLTDAVVAQQRRCIAELASSTTGADCGAGIVNPAGAIAEPTHLPRHTIKAGALYTLHLGAVNLIPSVNIENLGQYDVDAANSSAGTRERGYTLLNLGLRLTGARAGQQTWSIQANCENCTDRLVVAGSLPPTLYYQDPRRWTVALRYDF